MQRATRGDARPCAIEALESRTLFSAHPVADAVKAKPPATTTTVTLSKHASFLGQPVTLTVTVKSNQPHTTPTGTVELLGGGNPIDGLLGGPLTLTLNAKGKATYSYSTGNVALFVGRNTLSAEYLGNGAALPPSTAKATGVIVTGLDFTKLSDGLDVAAIQNGRGKAIAAGETAQVIYTGFLASNGMIFDYSSGHGAGQPTNLTFEVDANPEQVITGFDQGVLGMKVGATRVLLIPAGLGYGDLQHEDIPPDSDLLFYVTLQAIL
jgi:hypothetical protein